MNACPTCDELWHLETLEPNTAAYCQRCGHRLTAHREQALERAMAFSAAGIVLLLLASAFPFLSFAASGREVSMNLLDSALALFEHDQDVLGLVVFTLIFAGPLALLINQSTLLWLLLKNRRTPWLGRLARGLEALKTWNMIEVFLVSVFVSAAKLASMAQLELGAAFFAFVGFTLCTLISVHLIDEVQLWRRIQAIGS